VRPVLLPAIIFTFLTSVLLADDLALLGQLGQKLRTDPTNTELRYKKAVILHKMNRKEKALAEYGHVIKQSPCHFQALINGGNLAFDLGQTRSAEKSYRQAIHCAPDHHLGYYNAALIAEQEGNYEEARSLYQSALSRKADHGNSLHNLGSLEYRLAGKDQEKLSRAHFLLQKACNLGRDALCLYHLGQIQNDLGDAVKARATLRKAHFLARGSMRRKIQNVLQTL